MQHKTGGSVVILGSFAFLFYFFFNCERMITHSQETWKIQSKVAYSSTMYYS